MKVSFDIGGVMTRYPEKVRELMRALMAGGVDVFVLTDMPREMARRMLDLNGFGWIRDRHLLCADWNEHGERCKVVIVEREGIDLHFDDHAAYCAGSSSTLMAFLWPRPDLPYYAETWKQLPKEER